MQDSSEERACKQEKQSGCEQFSFVCGIVDLLQFGSALMLDLVTQLSI